MSMLSNFIILVGYGHHYGGEGMVIQAQLCFYMEKGGWFWTSPTTQESRYWFGESIEDALLMISLFILAPNCRDDEGLDEPDPFLELRRKAEELFEVPLSKRRINTQSEGCIRAEALRELYGDNSHALADSNVKLVVLDLGEYSARDFEGRTLREQFIEVAYDYGLRNVEVCQSTYIHSSGSFSNNRIHVHQAQVLPLE